MGVHKIGKRGQVTIPKSIWRAAGIPDESHVVAEVTKDGDILLRPAVELYSDARIAEFENANAIPATVEFKVGPFLKKVRNKG